MKSLRRIADPDTPPELARFEAQRLAFAPLVFQAMRVARDCGVFEAMYRAGERGVEPESLSAEIGMTKYAVSLLLEASYVAGFAAYTEPKFVITKAGVFWLKEAATRINTDFTHHVCYKGFFQFEESLREGLPVGLRALGPWKTLYEGLTSFTAIERDSWLAFDHFYSDEVFEICLPKVFEKPVGSLLDVGANTGKFTKRCLEHDQNVLVTMVDLPQQMALARENLASLPASARSRAHECAFDLLANGAPLAPAGSIDVAWMSQFLDCFSEDQIVAILERVRETLKPDGRVFILELLWNRQRHESARYCVVATSLYFACIANGNSRMYHSEELRRLIGRAGLKVVGENHEIGLCHSLLTCQRA